MEFIDLLLTYGAQALGWYALYVVVGSVLFGAYVWRRSTPGH